MGRQAKRRSLPKIVEGYRIGRLTVMEQTEKRRNGYMVWKCRCDCGNTVFLDTRCLQRGTIRDCGCTSVVAPGQRDITGMRFGRLTAICPVGTRNGNVVWHCKCDCGGEVDAPLRQLTAGYRKSCGCLSQPPLEDLTGRKFHMLTVTGYAGKRDGRAHYWDCVCDCGNKTTVRQDYLKSGKTQSCGCLQKEIILDNLRLVEGTSVTKLETMHGRRISSNTSGHTGVYWNAKSQKWTAQITFKRKTYYLGSYKNIEDAVKARKTGEEMHDNFLEWYYKTHSAYAKVFREETKK